MSRLKTKSDLHRKILKYIPKMQHENKNHKILQIEKC